MDRNNKVRTGFVSAVLLLLLLTSISLGQNSPSVVLKIKIKKISEDIYLAFHPDTLRLWVEGNVVIIINERDVVVVDASGAPVSARNVIAEIRKLTKKPVSYLNNTHGHGNHTIGNQEYRKAFPNIETVAHEKTAEYIAGSGFNYVDDIAKSTESRKRFGQDRTRAVDVRTKSRISDDACSKGDVSTGLSFL